MRISEMLSGKIPNATEQNIGNNPKSNTGFDMFFAEAERRQSFEPNVEHQGRHENRERGRTDETRTRRDEQSTRRREDWSRTEDVANTAATAAVQDTTQPTGNVESINDAAIKESLVIDDAAVILKIPAEAVAEMLQELGLTAQDLTDPQAVAKLLQEVLGAENPAELLTDSEFPELYKAINELMAKPKAEVKADTNVSVAEAEIQAKTADALEKGLEVTLEDGEPVVTQEKVTVEVSASNERPQATVTQADTAQITDYEQSGEVEITDATLLTNEDTSVNDTANPVLNAETVAVRIEQAVRQAAPPQPVNTTDVIEQIMNQVKLSSAGGNFTEIRMTLRPDNLGDIVLRVLTQNGIVTAQFEAESQRVKEALEADFNMLRDALTEQGIQFSELSVSVRQDENEQLHQFEKARQSSRYRAESIEDVSEEEEISYHNGVIDVTA
ncbi:MAG: flagellar hook-length control protein FliK [Defluviitaleaceae bacterium]|nr:flagellar hook-length control protein FliK [Defluviitaleaceae bacterium]